MKKALFVVLLITALCYPSAGQIRYIDGNGNAIDVSGGPQWTGIHDYIFEYRSTYGQYPDSKADLLDFIQELAKFDKDTCVETDVFLMENDTVIVIASKEDSLMSKSLAMRDSILFEMINDRNNVLDVSGDTCTFYIAKDGSTIQCIGGPEDLQRNDYDRFRSWIRSRVYDKNGKCLWSLCTEAPTLGSDINRKFRYVVTMDSRPSNVAIDLDCGLLCFRRNERTPPVLISINMNRGGEFNYIIPSLDGVQLYYQERGMPFSMGNALGTITLEKAIEQDRLDAIKTYMIEFMNGHEDVDSMRLWELVLFNNPPERRVGHE